jgi:hypothetical protein
MKGDHAPMRDNSKLFLAGRTIDVEWENGTLEANCMCVFVNASIIVFKPADKDYEVIAPWQSIFRVIRRLPV